MIDFSSAKSEAAPAEPALVAAWLHARSVARELPAPVSEHGGWRVDTASDTETCRYVFPAIEPGFVALSQSIAAPRIFLKLCAPNERLRDVLPPHWALQAPSWMMTGPVHVVSAHPLPPRYRLTTETKGNVVKVTVHADTGVLAASGYAAEAAGAFVYDRIVTAPGHQRRGLGHVVMAALGARRRSSATPVLVATSQGRALYATLGWRVHAPYASAVIPDA